MKTYKINEIFYSIQGEGARTGTANIFIRFAECNLTCGFCDTEFESFKEMDFEAIIQECYKYNCKNIIFTGGEPLLQLDKTLIDLFKYRGYFLAVETNGSIKPPEGLDWITVSPKVAEHVVEKNFFPLLVDELKYVRHTGQEIPKPKIQASNYFISPMFNGNLIDSENLNHCIELVKKNPLWKLTMQYHKWWKIR